MKTSFLVPALVLAAAPLRAEVVRAPNYEEALAQALHGSADIVVFQHGSDWNRLGERLLADVWNRSELDKALATNNVVLVAVDQPETSGNPAVAGAPAEDARPVYGPVDTPPARLARLLKEPVPASEISTVECGGGTTYTRLEDGTFLASGANPGQDVLVLTLTAVKGGGVLRLDFPTHPSLPGNGPGRASNGNYAISEVEVEVPGPVRLASGGAWAGLYEGGWGPWQAVDGVTDNDDNLWNAFGHRHQNGLLLVALEKPVAPGTRVVVRLVCKAKWAQHLPGTLRATILDDARMAADVGAVGRADALGSMNRKFTWRGDDVPRIALMDREGRHVASEDRPRLGLTPEALARRITEMQELRKQRDALWALAETQQGVEKAETLMKSLKLLGLGGSAGHENAYKFVHDKIREADPGDESGVRRWLQFQTDQRVGPEMNNPANKLAGEKKFEEAVALLDAEYRHPGNKHLTPDHLQRILLARFNIVRQWPGHEEQRFDVMREMAALDATTYLGIGATGYLAMNHKDPEPSALVYGWAASQVKPGANVWNFRLGTANYFDHPGRYVFRVLHGGGKDGLRIRRVALLAGEKVLSEASPAKDLAPGGKVECDLTLPASAPAGGLVLRLECDAGAGQTDSAGRFEVDPQL
ncbi:MAG: hypothetical protein U1F77_09000 [Kiritimatiellia bacterium]